MRRTRGLTILEVLVAMGLLLVLGIMMVSVVIFGLRQLERGKALAMGNSLAQQKMEEALQKAPGQLDPLTGAFSGQPDYRYEIRYAPHPTLTALQTVLVKVLGPSQTQVAFAQVLPGPSFTRPQSGSTRDLTGNNVGFTAILGKGTNTLNIFFLGSPTGSAVPTRFLLTLGAARVISSLSVVSVPTVATGMRGYVTFVDEAASPPSFCELYFLINSGVPTLLLYDSAASGTNVPPETPTAATPACITVSP